MGKKRRPDVGNFSTPYVLAILNIDEIVFVCSRDRI